MSRRRSQIFGMAAVVVFATAVPVLNAFAAFGFSSESSFLTAIKPGYYLEDFHAYDSVGLGGTFLGSSVNFGPVSGFSFTASAPTHGLFAIEQGSANGALSTNNPAESIVLTFTGSPVTAVGGNIFDSDSAGRPVNGVVSIQLADGSTLTVANDPGAFRGFTTTSPITSLQIYSTGGTTWPAVDHLYVGTAVVPEASSLLVWGGIALAIGGACWWQQGRRSLPVCS